MTGSAAAACGARLSRVDYVPAYPITPQIEMIETISRRVRKGEMEMLFDIMRSGGEPVKGAQGTLYLMREDEIEGIRRNLETAGAEMRQ